MKNIEKYFSYLNQTAEKTWCDQHEPIGEFVYTDARFHWAQ